MSTLFSTLVDSYGPDKRDVLATSRGNVDMVFLGHASLLFHIDNKLIYVDPSGAYAKIDHLPKADLIIVTHEHFDHLDPKAVEYLSKPETEIIATEQCKSIRPTLVMKNGDKTTFDGITIEAVPAYNLVHKNDKGEFFHPKGRGNGYVLTVGDKKIYIAGDTENIPEMSTLKDIDVAFLPMNLPYTMDASMFVDAVKRVKPKVVYPYHYKGSNPNVAKEMLKDYTSAEVRIKNFY